MMSRLTRDGTAEPVSRDQFPRCERGQGNIHFHFPCSADHEQDWQPYPVDPYSCYMLWPYIHTWRPGVKSVSSHLDLHIALSRSSTVERPKMSNMLLTVLRPPQEGGSPSSEETPPWIDRLVWYSTSIVVHHLSTHLGLRAKANSYLACKLVSCVQTRILRAVQITRYGPRNSFGRVYCITRYRTLQDQNIFKNWLLLIESIKRKS